MATAELVASPLPRSVGRLKLSEFAMMMNVMFRSGTFRMKEELPVQ